MNGRFSTSDFFKALSDPTRLNIVQLLSKQAAMCVCDITTQLGQPQPTVSRHLSQLKTQGLLSSKRRGTWIWYEIDKDLADWCQKVIELIPDTVSD